MRKRLSLFLALVLIVTLFPASTAHGIESVEFCPQCNDYITGTVIASVAGCYVACPYHPDIRINEWSHDNTDKYAVYIDNSCHSLCCYRCETVITTEAHEPGDDVDLVQGATCSSDRVMKSTCVFCEREVQFTVPGDRPAHTMVIDDAVPAKCNATGLTQGSHCSVCNQTIIAQEIIQMTAHIDVTDEAVAATCISTGLTQGSHCSVCNQTIIAQEVIPMTAHTVVIDNAVPASCTKTGLTEGSRCSVCNTILKAQEKIPASDHDWLITDDNTYECRFCHTKMVIQKPEANEKTNTAAVVSKIIPSSAHHNAEISSYINDALNNTTDVVILSDGKTNIACLSSDCSNTDNLSIELNEQPVDGVVLFTSEEGDSIISILPAETVQNIGLSIADLPDDQNHGLQLEIDNEVVNLSEPITENGIISFNLENGGQLQLSDSNQSYVIDEDSSETGNVIVVAENEDGSVSVRLDQADETESEDETDSAEENPPSNAADSNGENQSCENYVPHVNIVFSSKTLTPENTEEEKKEEEKEEERPEINSLDSDTAITIVPFPDISSDNQNNIDNQNDNIIQIVEFKDPETATNFVTYITVDEPKTEITYYDRGTAANSSTPERLCPPHLRTKLTFKSFFRFKELCLDCGKYV